VKALAQWKKTQDPIASEKKIKKSGSQEKCYLRREDSSLLNAKEKIKFSGTL
jgi:Fe-S cluster biosynthesis and repair protein YggX